MHLRLGLFYSIFYFLFLLKTPTPFASSYIFLSTRRYHAYLGSIMQFCFLF